MDRSRVLEQVRKLMALAGNNPSEAEVQAALGKARQLMDKYDIEEAEVNVQADDTTNSAQVNEVDGVRRKGNLERMDLIVAAAVAKVCSCEATNVRVGEHSVMRFIGFPRDIAVAKALMEELRIIMRTMARVAYGQKWGNQHLSYATGFAVRLWERAAANEAEREQAPASAVGAIVLAKGGAIARYKERTYKPLPPKRPSNRIQRLSTEAYNKGWEQGAAVNLGTNSLPGA